MAFPPELEMYCENTGKVYYKDDNAILLHGDCREVLLAIRDGIHRPQDAPALILTDPPYDFQPKGGGMFKGADHMKRIVELGTHEFDVKDFIPFLISYQLATQRYINSYFFCNKDLLLDYMQMYVKLAQDKEAGYSWDIINLSREPIQQAHSSHYNPHMEYAFFIRSRGSTFNGFINTKGMEWLYDKIFAWHRMTQKKTTSHPNEKPLALIKKLAMISARSGDIVLDPFLGSGTTALACKHLGLLCIGIDKDRDCLQMAVDRLSERSLF